MAAARAAAAARDHSHFRAAPRSPTIPPPSTQHSTRASTHPHLSTTGAADNNATKAARKARPPARRRGEAVLLCARWRAALDNDSTTLSRPLVAPIGGCKGEQRGPGEGVQRAALCPRAWRAAEKERAPLVAAISRAIVAALSPPPPPPPCCRRSSGAAMADPVAELLSRINGTKPDIDTSIKKCAAERGRPPPGWPSLGPPGALAGPASDACLRRPSLLPPPPWPGWTPT